MKEAIQVGFHENLASAKAINAYHKIGQEGEIGIILNLTPSYPRDENNPEDVKAAKIADAFFNRSFLDPAVKGEFPQELIAIVKELEMMPEMRAGDLATIAKRNQAKLHILYVNEVMGNYFGDFAFVTTNLQEELDEVAENQMKEHRNLAIEKGLTDIETYILYGYPKTLIANFNESKEKIDLIVMGATGLNAVERALVGSTTSYVVNHAPCNVLVVK